MRHATRVYDRYLALSNALIDKYRRAIVRADPRLPKDAAFHLAGNWGNDASRRILRRYQHVSTLLYYRGEREYRRAELRDR